MTTGINLISLEYRKSIQFTILKKKLSQAVFLVLVLFILFSVTIIGTFFYLSNNLKNNEKKVQLLKNQIKTLENKETHAVVVADRVKLINTVIENRKSYLSFLNDLETLLIPDLKIESLDFSTNFLKLSGVCANNQVLSSLNSQVELLKEKDDYSVINIIEVRRLENGSYNIALELKK
ncbi:MAG: hypothetical protein ACOX50_01845 [Patescibacteria group bacterium]|jgi:hypothetical protein